MSFSGNHIPIFEVVDIATYCRHRTDELVTDGHRHGNGGLGPLVPFVDVDVGAADPRTQHLDQHVADPDFGKGQFLEPQAGLALALHQRFHT